jgi:hypothetical protein
MRDELVEDLTQKPEDGNAHTHTHIAIYHAISPISTALMTMIRVLHIWPVPRRSALGQEPALSGRPQAQGALLSHAYDSYAPAARQGYPDFGDIPMSR